MSRHIVEGSVAGGDLTGTFPNPSVPAIVPPGGQPDQVLTRYGVGPTDFSFADPAVELEVRQGGFTTQTAVQRVDFEGDVTTEATSTPNGVIVTIPDRVHRDGDTMTGDLARSTASGYKTRYKRANTGNVGSITNETLNPGGGYSIYSPGVKKAAATGNTYSAPTYSIAIWFKIAGSSPDYGGIVECTGANDAYSPICILRNGSGGALQFRIGDGSVSYQFSTTSTSWFDNNWHLVVATYDGANIKVYKDGSLDTTYATTYVPANHATYTAGFCIGAYNQIVSLYTSSGYFDGCRYYKNRVLSGAEVTALYNGGAGVRGTVPDTNLYVGYNFDEGTGLTSADYSGNGKTLTLSSGITWGDGIIQDSLGSGVFENTVIKSEDGVSFFESGVNTLSNATARTNIIGKTIRFLIGAVEKMRISEQGYVGIGTLSPTSPLTVNNVTGAAITIQQNGVDQVYIDSSGSLTPAVGAQFQIRAGNGTPTFSQVAADWPKFENTVYVASLLYFTSGTAGMVQAGYAPIKINETALLVGNYSNAAGVKVVTQATAGQSVDIVQVKNSGGTVIASIGPNGEGYFPNVGYVLFNHYADAGNTTTTETDLYSDTVAAGKLAVNGAKIDAKYGGVNVNSTSTKQLRVYFGGTMIFDTGALTISAASSWELEVLAIRVSASVVRCSCKLNLTGASTGSFANYVEVTGLTLTNSQVIKITGQAAGVGAATNDIVAKLGAAIFYAS